MKLFPILVVLVAGLISVQADFHLNLYDKTTKKYLSGILVLPDDHYIKAAKDSPDQFCRFNFVTSSLPNGKVSFQNMALNVSNYFNLTTDNYIRANANSITASSEFDFIFESDLHRKRGARIALKANNGLYWTVVDKFVKAEATSPVYFDIYPVDYGKTEL